MEVESADAQLEPKPFRESIPDKTDFIIAYGVRREGKSWACRYLCWCMRAYFSHGEVFSATAFNGFWQKHFPGWKVFPGWRPGVIAQIMREQAHIAKLYKEDPSCINPWRLIILDDCVHDCGHDPLLKELAQTGRHYYICVIITTQHPTALLPAIRSNADIALIFNIHKRQALETLAEDLMPQLKTNNAVEHLQKFCYKPPPDKKNEASQCLVVVSRLGGNLQNRLFYLQAPDPGNFIIGCKEYWSKQSLLEIAKEHMTRTKGRGIEELVFESDSDDDDVGDRPKLEGKWDNATMHEHKLILPQQQRTTIKY